MWQYCFVVFWAAIVEVSRFKEKWGFTQEEIAKLMRTNRSTIAHWLAEGKHDAGRSGSTSAQMSLEFLDLLLTVRMQMDYRYPEECELYLVAKRRGKGLVFQNKKGEV